MRDASVLWFSLVLLAYFSPALAADPPKVEPALNPDPKVIQVLQDLGDSSSALLTGLKTIGEWNVVTKEYGMERTGPMGRDYTNKAVWMPDRRRAFFCGANHGSPHRLNDAWEFDLPSHTWVMLFAPDPNNARGVMEIKEFDVAGKKVKYVQTQRGGPTHFGHTWWAFCYDPGMKAALWMNVHIGETPARYIEKETGSKEGVYAGPPMWAFLPWEKKWKMVFSIPPYPRVPYAAQMEFVPDLGGPVLVSGNWSGDGTWLYNGKENAWKQLNKKTNEPIYESLMDYDRDNKLLVVQEPNKATFHYDIKANQWTKVLDPGKDSSDAPSGHDARTQMYYDPVGKVCLLYDATTPGFMWSYSVKDRKWTKNKVNGPEGLKGRIIAYFDEVHNVFVVNVGPSTWVYRYKKQGG
jgi:hypothetical protein